MHTLYFFMLNCVNFCLAAITKLNDVIYYACVIIFYILICLSRLIARVYSINLDAYIAINFDLILTLKMKVCIINYAYFIFFMLNCVNFCLTAVTKLNDVIYYTQRLL